jgi:thioesterase domain-containing protein/acyl carrier protein
MYRTGDLARLLPSGEVVVLGRMDNQVKLRGFRIELGEIEHALLTMEEVADAAVVTLDDSLGEKMLAAYVVSTGPAAPEDDFEAKLRASLRRTLPGYMVPSLFVVLEKLPKLANGKLDRRALPAASARERTVDEGPLTPTEQQFSGLIGELLGVGSVPVSADIFELGFHSLLAARLVTRITSTFGVAIPFRSLFSSPTVRGLSRVIDEAVGGPREAVVAAPIVTLNPNGTRVPFVYLHSDLYSHGLYCEKLAAALGSDQPFIAVAPHGTAGLPLLPTIEAMAVDYLARIRAVQPHGPYRLGGFCVSGLVAYELARMLRAQGEMVDDVILINSSALPERSFRPIDWLVARFGLDAGIESRLRERIIYNLARVNAAVVDGPRGTVRMLAELGLNLVYRNRRARRMNAEPSPFEKVSGNEDTENSFAHLVAGLTYHPKPYGGKVTLIWGVDQGPSNEDPTIGWGTLTPHVRVVPIEAGHVTVLRENIGELARALMNPLREGTNG